MVAAQEAQVAAAELAGLEVMAISLRLTFRRPWSGPGHRAEAQAFQGNVPREAVAEVVQTTPAEVARKARLAFPNKGRQGVTIRRSYSCLGRLSMSPRIRSNTSGSARALIAISGSNCRGLSRRLRRRPDRRCWPN